MRRRLTLLPARKGYDPAASIPKYGIEHDINFFDYQSLVRMYGKTEIDRYIRSMQGRLK